MSSGTDGKKKSKFKFKNGFKNLTKSVKKNDTVKHFTGAPKPNETNNETSGRQSSSSFSFGSNKNGGNSNKSRKRTLSLGKKKKIERPKLPKLNLAEYTYPKQVLIPSESWGEQQYDKEDRQIHEYLKTKYQNDISKLSFFPSDIILRFTISQRGMTPFSERKKETELHFKTYLKYHAGNHYDDILTNEMLNSNKSLSSLKDDVKALPLFIYGQDKEGHPIFWDDGSAYSKDAQLKIFKEDMKRVGIFRARLMKKMHNLKLAASKHYGKMIYKHCLVMDLSSFNAKQFVKDRKFHEQNTKDISDLFPEVLHRLYIINAPWAFRSAWKVIQTFLHPITVEKTKILGKDFINELQKDVNLDMIPYKFGGIGPWDIVYGDVPFKYPLSSRDIDFDYTSLPKNTLPVPPRTPVPDMNKHKAKQQKQMKSSGLKDALDNVIQFEDDNNDEQKEDQFPNIDENEELGMDVKVKSAPFQKTQSTINNNNGNTKQGVGDQKDEE